MLLKREGGVQLKSMTLVPERQGITMAPQARPEAKRAIICPLIILLLATTHFRVDCGMRLFTCYACGV